MTSPYVISVGVADVRREPDPTSELVTQALMNSTTIPDEDRGLYVSLLFCHFWMRPSAACTGSPPRRTHRLANAEEYRDTAT